jgi:hypothetical protein
MFTIITPNWNGERFLERAIKSVMSQREAGVELEYIFIDGGSTDRSMEIVERYRDHIDVVISEKDNGPASAINKGLRMAKTAMKSHSHGILAAVFLLCSFQTAFGGDSPRRYDDRGRPIPGAFESSGFALGLNAGTLGAGVEATLRLTTWANLRVSGHAYGFIYKDTIDGIDYTFDIDMENVVAGLEIYPGARSVFKFVGGAVFSGNEISVLGVPQLPIDSRVVGEVACDEIAPYIGIGFGNHVREDTNFSIALDLGVIFQEYALTLTTEGSGSDLAFVEQNRQDFENDVNGVLEQIKIYPVVTVSIAYQF